MGTYVKHVNFPTISSITILHSTELLINFHREFNKNHYKRFFGPSRYSHLVQPFVIFYSKTVETNESRASKIMRKKRRRNSSYWLLVIGTRKPTLLYRFSRVALQIEALDTEKRAFYILPLEYVATD